MSSISTSPPSAREQGGEVGGERGLGGDGGAGRVREGDAGGVERLAGEEEAGGEIGDEALVAEADEGVVTVGVELVADDRVAGGGEVGTDLVLAAGDEDAADEGESAGGVEAR